MGNNPTQELATDDTKVDDKAPSTKPVPPSTSAVNTKTKADAEREQLFDDGSSDVHTPRKKSTQEILTKYKFKGDAAAAAAHTKQKLMERQEKLARITEQSAELESEAENFATLAQQIRINMEKKWWK
ncbi:uncharacterized protein LOC120693005 [Panicum virgatum]|uniref:V-SNARE coiled-coil homology domain-containing protein n=1 Tax=Panicum virgatum TaxID=38727 RepID=A0A8T0N354_PANVG|nr:uncharacterized protein LOC120693005 [Panicum virgatum]KAG2541554.1 hypothetical protein PVAP13_9NG685700 [Panicum virgatum]